MLVSNAGAAAAAAAALDSPANRTHYPFCSGSFPFDVASLFSYVTQRRLVVTDVSGQPTGPIFKVLLGLLYRLKFVPKLQ